MLYSTDLPAVPSFVVPTLYPLNIRLFEALPGNLKVYFGNNDSRY